jgi:hypothetical protein
VNGFRTRLPDLLTLLRGRNPAVVCLQATHLRPSPPLRLRGYTTHRYDHPDGEGASGGTAIPVKDCICSVPVNIRSPLQVIAVRAHLPTLHATLCSIYRPPAVPARRADLANLLSQSPPTFILGSCNAKHILWGGNLTDERGALVYDVYADSDVILLDTGAHTALCLGSGASSALDLTPL